MRFEYTPETESSWDRQHIKDLIRWIVAKYGRPRSAVRIHGEVVFLSFDTPGGLMLAGDLLDLAAGGLESMHYEAIQDMAPHGWLGNLEPGSPETHLFRNGPPRTIGTFLYESSLSSTDEAPYRLTGSECAVEVVQSGETSCVKARGNSDAILSLARHVVWLSDPQRRLGQSIEYELRNGLAGSLKRVAIVRDEFSPAVPWARPPGR